MKTRRCPFLIVAILLHAVASDSLTAQTKEHYPANREPLKAGAYVHLPLGAVKPRGWLRRQLEIQADGLTGFCYSEFKAPCHPNHKACYEGAVLALAHLLERPRLKRLARGYVEGMLGAKHHTFHENTQYALKALMEYHEASGDARVVELLSKCLKGAAGGKPERWGTDVRWGEALAPAYWLYNHTGDEEILRIVERDLKARIDKDTQAFLSLPATIPSTHGVDLAMKIKYPGLYYQQRPEDAYKKAVFEGIARLDKHYGQAAGRFTGHEHVGELDKGLEPTNGTELCAVIEYMYSMEKLFEIFGEVALADRLEVLAYNALPGAMTPDMWAHQYDQQANQVLVNRAKRIFDNGPEANLYGLSPNFSCCLTVMHQAWPRFVQSMWMATHDRGLVCAAYGPCEVSAKVGDGRTVKITEETEYPFRGKITLAVSTPAAVRFPLYLRIPKWSEGATVDVNGAKRAERAGTMARVTRLWKQGDRVVIDLPMRVRCETRFNRSAAILRGPLYFSLRIGQEYRSIRSHAANGYPVYDWEIHPLTPWNYGLVADRANPDRHVRVVTNKAGDFPFAGKGEPLFARIDEKEHREIPAEEVHAAEFADENGAKKKVTFRRIEYTDDEPVVLKMRARLLPQWKMNRRGVSAANPPVSPARSDRPIVQLDLVPYGCARLRITEFPLLPP